MNESFLNTKAKLYFGNNRAKNLKLSKPEWYAPFFLTTDYAYAEDYADYGVYSIDLKHESQLNILNFKNSSEISKLKWPKILINQILTGKSDLNSIAYDLFLLAQDSNINNSKLMQITNSPEWKLVASYFKKKSHGLILTIPPTRSTWGSDKDHEFVLQMWKDIYDAGFDGFVQTEFNHKILAIFTFKCIDKISIYPITH